MSHLDHNNKQDYHGDAPELPPRHAARGGDRLSSNSNFEICPQGEDGKLNVKFCFGRK